MSDTEREKITTTYNGLNKGQRAYLLAHFPYIELLEELNCRLYDYETKVGKISETLSSPQ